MKRIITISAIAMLSLAGCKATSVEQRMKEYEDAGRAIVDKFRAGEISEDDACQQVYENALKAIRKNADNEVALAALGDLRGLVDDAQMLKAIGLLKGDNAGAEPVIALKEGIEKRKKTAEGQKFIDFEVNGVKFSDFIGKGKYVLVDFWASWCGPCKGEIPNIKAVWEKYSGPEFNVLSIAVWDKPEDTAAAAEEHGVVWPQIVDAQRIPTDIYGIEGIPQIMLFGPDGTILKRDLRGEDIEKEVSRYVQPR